MTFPRGAINEALSLLPPKWDTETARVCHAAIGYQETKYKNRRQLIKVNGVLKEAGPACGYWQFEKGGAVKGLMQFGGLVTSKAMQVCNVRGVPWRLDDVWLALSQDDVLAAAFARLLMYTDPKPLPTTQQAAWDFYLATWRPGKPHPEDWPAAWAFAKANA